ncbi:MAG: PAS domain S-box protein [Bacteroidales bacterium]|nr:PAS domain S-box protein [Bacteroidales bacterium]
MEINYLQIFILIAQAILVGVLILFLFNLRKKWGNGLLFAAIGLFQFIQVFLSSTLYFQISENIFITHGSAIFFMVSIFTVLIIYIKDDALETRKIIYALLITNIVMTVLLLSLRLNFTASPAYNPLEVNVELFNNSALLLIVGTLTMGIDALLIILFYEFISRYISPLLFRIMITMVVVVSIDTVIFSTISFVKYEQMESILVSGLISKISVAVIYSVLFTIYLKNFEKVKVNCSASTLKDVFYTLTYKQKFEKIEKEKHEAETASAISESRYKTLTNFFPVGVFVTDVKGDTIFVNPKWCEITGLTPESAMGKGWHKALHPDDKKYLLVNWKKASSKQHANYEEYRFMTDDGKVTWVLGQAVPEIGHDGKIVGYVGTITDITELKGFELKLEELKYKAEESDKLKSAFLANMSHEIRTPMNGILGFTELLRDTTITPDEQKEYLKIIEISGNRMMEIINNIVDISKIESGLAELKYEKVNISTICGDLYDFFEAEAKLKGLKLSLNSPSFKFEPNIFIDRNKTISVLTNLIKNAIKYTNDGEIEFGYFINRNPTQHLFEFYVRDTGIGISEDRQEAVFERFIQADINDKAAKQGAGLGLAIAKAYVELMNGKISLSSKVGVGSEFKVEIPFVSMSHFVGNQVLSFKEEDLKKNLKVLIAEDDLNSFLIYSVCARNANWSIFHVVNGIEAVETARKNPDIDLILMDIKMPLMNGLTAAKKIREFLPDVIIIAQSAYTPDYKDGDENIPFNQYLIKPIDKKTFIMAISEFFND